MLTVRLAVGFEQIVGEDVVVGRGSKDQVVENVLGCHARFKKQPDVSMYVVDHLKGQQKCPIIVAEISQTHESLHMLFCEAHAWLNNTGVKYVILVKYMAEVKG